MSKTKISPRKLVRAALIVLLVFIILCSGTYLLHWWDQRQGAFAPSDENQDMTSTVTYDGKEYVLKDRVESFLVMGLDKFEEDVDNTAYKNDQQSDFVMLFVFDNEAKTCSALHINRDAMVEINVLGVAGQKIDTVQKQLALAHTYGNGREVSCRNTSDAVSGLLRGMKINHYASLTMDAVATFNDLVGGVEVQVLDDFTGIDDTLVKGETVTLRGEQALTYVRSRKGMDDSTSAARMNRQQQYIKALYRATQTKIEQDDEFVVDATMKTKDYLVTDRSVTQLQTLLEKVTTYEFKGLRSLEGESKLGEKFVEFYPDEDSVEQQVIELFYEPKE